LTICDTSKTTGIPEVDIALQNLALQFSVY